MFLNSLLNFYFDCKMMQIQENAAYEPDSSKKNDKKIKKKTRINIKEQKPVDEK